MKSMIRVTRRPAWAFAFALALLTACRLNAGDPCFPNAPIPGWKTANIGGFPNGSSQGGPLWVLCSDAFGFAASGDAVRYLYQDVSGNFEIVVRLTDFNGPRIGGLMVRTDPFLSDAAFAAVYVEWPPSSSPIVVTSVRHESGGPASIGVGQPSGAGLPFWMKIRREGDMLTTAFSPNGINYVGQLSFPSPEFGAATLSAGLIQASDASQVTGSAYFSDAQITKLSIQHGFIRADANTDGRIDISDALSVFGHLFRGDTELRCLDGADANDDGRIDISDGIRILGFLFRGDHLPEGTTPGERQEDFTPDELGCRADPGPGGGV